MLAPIRLARELPFRLGEICVYPAMRQVVYNGRSETLEPRIMQVLVAFAQANGAILSRDDLINRCWDGCVVGDNAIQRTISKIRELSRSLGGAFHLETIAKVGYRMISGHILTDAPPPNFVDAVSSISSMAALEQPPAPQAALDPPIEPRNGPSRRLAIASVGAVVLAVTVAGVADRRLIWRTRSPGPTIPAPVPADIVTLAARGMQELGDPSPSSMLRGIALFQQAIDRAPGYADAWGGMAYGYALLSHEAPSTAKAMQVRALAAIDRAQALDPHNAYLWLAKGRMLPLRAWLERERIIRQGLAYHPSDGWLLHSLATVLANTGRMSEAATLTSRASAVLHTSNMGWFHIYVLWAANRLADADKAAIEELSLYPRDYTVWINWVMMLTNTGRCEEALAALADRDTRPPDIPDVDFDDLTAAAMALKTGFKADVARAGTRLMAAAHRGSAYAEHAMQFLSTLGLVDMAFAVADANYFDRGFSVSPFRYTKTVARYAALGNRRTMGLFSPATQNMRRDARFPKLISQLGLVRYWKDSGSHPDYQRTKLI